MLKVTKDKKMLMQQIHKKDKKVSKIKEEEKVFKVTKDKKVLMKQKDKKI